jgi:hypothetical protein
MNPLEWGLFGVGCAIYVAGVVVGLILVDAKTLGKLGLALLWPLGPLAFVVTLAALSVTALIAYPPLAVVAALLGGLWWALS